MNDFHESSAITPAPGPTTSLGSLLRLASKRWPDRPFLVFPDGTRTYRQVHDEASAIAKAFIARGLEKGQHVAILMPNCIEAATLLFAAHLAGGVAVPINARFKRRELRHVIAHSDARFLFTTQVVREHIDFVELIRDALDVPATTVPGGRLSLAVAPQMEAIVVLGGETPPGVLGVDEFLAGGVSVPDSVVDEAADSVSARDTAFLLYTSGTTALPKGCEITHDGLVRSWTAFADVVALRNGGGIWTPCPFFHIGGIGPMTAALVRGAMLLSMTHFTPAAALDLLRTHKPEHLFPAFPPLTLGTFRHPAYRPQDFDFVETVVNVAPAETQRLIQALLPPTAILLNDFGMTEGAGMITLTRPSDPPSERLSSNGHPLPGIEVRIVDQSTRSPLQSGMPGEIQFRGVNAFRAYYKDAATTASTIDPSGWVSTGDLGELAANGALFFIGRIKDILKVGGENVAPAEVEAHLGTHPAVKLAQVVGRPDNKYGEVPVAFVELLPDATASAEDLISHCIGHLASFKVPREIRFVSEWPMSATKIQKFRLREML
jgi:acyl-CoA synthetase (AMP-forming)/AMP-acid ligase II